MLFAQLAKERFNKPLTVTNAMRLHTFEERPDGNDHAALFSTSEETCSADNLEAPNSCNCSGCAFVEQQFISRYLFNESDRFNFTTVEERNDL